MVRAEGQKTKRRSPVVAGLFYPEGREAAEELLRSYGQGTGDSAQAILVPHASWSLSGPAVGAAFAAAAKLKPRTVVLLGPVHDAHEEGIFLSDSDAFSTPLGELPVDRELCEELASCSTLISVNDIPHLSEHSLEVVLPFVKFRFPDAMILPILIAGFKAAAVTALSRALDLVLPSQEEGRTLIVVSSNLSEHLDSELAVAHSDAFLRLLLARDAGGIMEGLRSGGLSACGGAAAAALLSCRWAGSGAPRLLWDSTARAFDEEPEREVRYAAVAFE